MSRELHRLEPDAGPTLHCGGQESDTSQYVDAAGGAFARYSEFMAANAAAPAVQMWYTSLLGETFSSPGSGAAWGRMLSAALDNHTNESTLIIPQIGLNLPSGQDLAHVTTPAGLAAIDEFGRGLQALERPAFVNARCSCPCLHLGWPFDTTVQPPSSTPPQPSTTPEPGKLMHPA